MWSAILNFILKLIGLEIKGRKESEADALKGRGQSIEDSFKEQEKARKDAEKAKEEAKDQGNDDDVFGAEEYNNG